MIFTSHVTVLVWMHGRLYSCHSVSLSPEDEGKPVSKFRYVLLHHFLTACAENSTFRLHALCAFIQSAVLIVHGNRSYRKCNSPGNWNSDCTGITVGRLYFRFGDLRNRTSSPDQLEQLKQIGSIRGCYHDKKGRNQVRCMKPAPQSCFWIQPSKLHGPKLAQKGDVVQSRWIHCHANSTSVAILSKKLFGFIRWAWNIGQSCQLSSARPCQSTWEQR